MNILAVIAYSYIRFSHPDQARGDSLRRQVALRDAWLARNNVILDTSLTLEDKGISGFTGEHRKNPDRHGLAAFLQAVERGRIPRGSYLIVESLDRLSREDILPALSLVLNLIQAGIRIVQLLPVEMVYDENANPMHLMMMIMELSRGHSESMMKSERVGGAWQDKKKRAAETGEPVTARTPSWLRLVDGEWEVDERAADVVRRIYRLAIDGHGLGIITQKLNAEHVSVIGRGAYWARSYVAKILANRAVIGEYQPHKGRGRTRQHDGKPIPGYYPALISEKEWYAARAALGSRRNKPGRLAKGRINVFAGLLRDARDKGTLQLVNKGKKTSHKTLVSYRATQGIEGSQTTSFPFDVFERAVLSCLREIDPADILPRSDRGADKALSLTGRLAEVDAEIEKIKARLQKKYSDALADVLDRQEGERKSLSDQLNEARQEAASPLGEAWGQCQSLLDVVETMPDAEEARVTLRAALRRIVENIWCLFVARKSRRLAVVQIHFAGGSRRRDYLILSQPALGGSAGTRPASWWVRSFAEVPEVGSIDLRQPADVAKVEEFLQGLDLSEQ